MADNKKYSDWVSGLESASMLEIQTGELPLDAGSTTKKFTPGAIFKSIPIANMQNGDYTLELGDELIITSAASISSTTKSIPAGVFSNYSTITFVNESEFDVFIVLSGELGLYLAGVSSASVTIPPHCSGIALKASDYAWHITGGGLYIT